MTGLGTSEAQQTPIQNRGREGGREEGRKGGREGRIKHSS